MKESHAEKIGRYLSKYRTEGGFAIRTHRTGKGLTQAELAKQLGISVVHLSNVENGHADPTETLKRIYRLRKKKLPRLAQ